MKIFRYFFICCLLGFFVTTMFAEEKKSDSLRILLTKDIKTNGAEITFSAIGTTKAPIVLNYGEGKLRKDTLALTKKTITDILKGDTLWIYADSTSFINFDVSNQKLNSLSFIGVKNLMNVNCGNNAIPLDKLPNISDTLVNYIYAPQLNYQIKNTYILGDTIDCSRFMNLKGVKLEAQTSRFVWRNTLGDTLLKGLDYLETNGKFIFLKEQIDSVYAIVNTEAFPAFKNKNIYRTSCTQINARLSSPILQCKLVTQAKAGDTICLTFKGRKQGENFVWIKLSEINTQKVALDTGFKTVKYAIEGNSIEISTSPNVLSEFDCSNNKLTKLDIEGAVSLRKLWCDSNLLDTLEISKLYYLNELNCSNNRLHFNTLPTKQKHLNVYVYAPQSRLKLTDSVYLYNPIDLNIYSRIQGIADTLQNTHFKWFTEKGEPLGKDIDYTEIDNVFKFIKTVEEGAYVEMSTAAFPSFKEKNTFRSAPILVKEYSQPMLEMILIGVAKDTNSDFRFYVRGNMDGVPIEVDFGDNKKVRLFVNTTTTLLSGKRRGENIVIYAAEGALLYLNCFYNQIHSLDVTYCESLQALNCSENTIATLDLSQNTLLQEINCSNNALTVLDLSKHKSVRKLLCNDNRLTHLNVGHLVDLVELNCSNNSLDSVDIKEALNLENVQCSRNNLKLIDLVRHTKIKRLLIQENQFNFATLPIRDTLWLQYEYAPQAELEIRGEITNDDTLDLSYLAFSHSLEGDDVATQFLWRKYSGEILEKDIDYMEDGGRFVFQKGKDSVFCTMENLAFPRLRGQDALRTSGTYVNIVKTGDTTHIISDKILEIQTKMSVYSVPGGIVIKDAAIGKDLFIFNLQGQLILKEKNRSMEKQYSLARGFYMIRSENDLKKVVVL